MTLTNINQYGPGFQVKVLAALLNHKEFLINIHDIISEEYFESQAHKWLIKEILKYYDKYHTTPSLEVLKVEYKKVQNEVLQIAIKEQLREAYKESDDLAYVEEEFSAFCKNQMLKKALLQSVDLLQAGDYDSIKFMIESAMKAGQDKNLGHEYNKDIEPRYREEHRISIPTPWNEFNTLLQGGLGNGDFGLIFGNPGGGKRMPSYRDIAETMDGDELDAILDVSLQGLARAREKGSQPMYSNSPEGLKSFKHDSEEYLTFVRNVNKTPTEGGKLRLVPDIESWAAFLGVTRHMITGYEKRGSDWKSTIDAVKGVITACKKQLAFTGKMPPVLAIFDLTNNSDYVNASEFRLSAEAAPEAKQITAEEWEKVIDAEPEAPKLSDFKLSDDLN